jgi:hypothetical protein
MGFDRRVPAMGLASASRTQEGPATIAGGDDRVLFLGGAWCTSNWRSEICGRSTLAGWRRSIASPRESEKTRAQTGAGVRAGSQAGGHRRAANSQ